MFQVESWFAKLFPESHFPINRLRGVLLRAEVKVKSIFDAGGDLSSYLSIPLDLDFVSASLHQKGLKFGHLLEKIPLPTGMVAGPLTHQLVLDLESFRKKENLPKTFTSKWIRKLSDCEDDDKTLTKSVEQLKACHDELTSKKKHDMKSVFLATIFQSTAVRRPAQQPPGLNVSARKSESSASSSKCKTCSGHEKDVIRLTENKVKQDAEISVLKETIVDLSRDKVELAKKIAAKDKVETRVEKLKTDLMQIKMDTNPRRVARLQNRLKMLKDAARSKNHTHKRLLEVKAEMNAVRGAAMVQKCNLQRAVRNAQKKLSS